jgi:hypothetical protein
MFVPTLDTLNRSGGVGMYACALCREPKYTSPVAGLKDIGCQLCAPRPVGVTNATLPVTSKRVSGFWIGRPVLRSTPLAQFTGANASAEISSPLFASST